MLKMNYRSIVAGLAITGMVFAVGCGSTQEETSTASSAQATEKPAPKINPQEGMTKDQIATMYQGQPDSKRTRSDGGKVWRYHMNAGEQYIPFNYGYQPEYDVIKFGPDGKVTSYELSHEPEK